MVHNRLFSTKIRFISPARKNSRPQTPNDETVLADKTNYVWDPEWSHTLFFSISNNISIATSATVSYTKIVQK